MLMNTRIRRDFSEGGGRYCMSIMDTFKKAKKGIFSLVGGANQAPKEEQDLPVLEPIDFPDPAVNPGKHPDLVVDFGTTSTVVALVDDIHDTQGGRRVRLSFLAGETEHPSRNDG